MIAETRTKRYVETCPPGGDDTNVERDLGAHGSLFLLGSVSPTLGFSGSDRRLMFKVEENATTPSRNPTRILTLDGSDGRHTTRRPRLTRWLPSVCSETIKVITYRLLMARDVGNDQGRRVVDYRFAATLLGDFTRFWSLGVTLNGFQVCLYSPGTKLLYGRS